MTKEGNIRAAEEDRINEVVGEGMRKSNERGDLAQSTLYPHMVRWGGGSALNR